jgi:YD repeat-containing protein
MAYAYDAAGQLVERTKGLMQAGTFTYDAAGHLTARTAAGVTTFFVRDGAGRLLRAENPDAGASTARWTAASAATSATGRRLARPIVVGPNSGAGQQLHLVAVRRQASVPSTSTRLRCIGNATGPLRTCGTADLSCAVARTRLTSPHLRRAPHDIAAQFWGILNCGSINGTRALIGANRARKHSGRPWACWRSRQPPRSALRPCTRTRRPISRSAPSARTVGKRVGGNPSRVRISYPPPLPHRARCRWAPQQAAGLIVIFRLSWRLRLSPCCLRSLVGSPSAGQPDPAGGARATAIGESLAHPGRPSRQA